MNSTLTLRTEDQLIANSFTTKPKENSSSRKMIGVEVDLFSYTIPESHFERVLTETCGEQFSYEALSHDHSDAISFFITPKDHCLVDGGMMYTSAVSILKKMTQRGLLVEEFRTVKLIEK